MSEAILDAALHLFVEQGYAGTSMRAIAREAGQRSVAGLYNHYANKQAIMDALMVRHSPYSAFRAALVEAQQAAEDRDRLRSFIQNVLLLIAEHEDFLQLVQIDARELDGQTLETLVAEENLQPDVLLAIGTVLNGEGIRPTEPLVFIRLLATIGFGYAATGQLAPSGIFDVYEPVEWAETFATIIVHGLYE